MIRYHLSLGKGFSPSNAAGQIKITIAQYPLKSIVRTDRCPEQIRYSPRVGTKPFRHERHNRNGRNANTVSHGTTEVILLTALIQTAATTGTAGPADQPGGGA